MSKTLEKAILKQLLQTLEVNNIFEKIQSGFCQKDSTEIFSDLLMCADVGEVCFTFALFNCGFGHSGPWYFDR